MIEDLIARDPNNDRQRETCEQLKELLVHGRESILRADSTGAILSHVRDITKACKRHLEAAERGDGMLTQTITGLALLTDGSDVDFHVDAKALLGTPAYVVPDSDYRNVIIQGIGDLSMNAWNVAFVNASDAPVYAPAGEPLWERTYTCFGEIKDSSEVAAGKHSAADNPFTSLDPHIGGVLDSVTCDGPDLVIARFTLQTLAPHVRLANQSHTPVQSWLSCAVYGKAVIWDGEVLGPSMNIDEWSDFRHVFELPNLNPPTPAPIKELAKQWVDEGARPEDAERFARAWSHRPRLLFGERQDNDVWLFEQQLLAPGGQNLRRLACLAPICVDLAELHVPRVWIDYCLRGTRYRPAKDRKSTQMKRGEYRWESGSRTRIEIYLQRNRYPCTIVGIGRIRIGHSAPDPGRVVVHPLGSSAKADANNALFALAVGGRTFEQSQFTIWDHAELLKEMGCRYALVFDEGHDVFQGVIPTASKAQYIAENPEYDETNYMRVPRSPSRNRIRAHLAIRQVRRTNA
jgi:hypothetical protein